MDFIFYVLCGMLSGFCLCRIFTPSRADIESELEIERYAAINKAYISGYNLGKLDGKQEGMFEKYSPNELREFLGLPKIENEGQRNELERL